MNKDQTERTDAEWREILSDEEYRILRQKGTERAFTGKYNESSEEGTFVCSGCGNPLFSSDAKYDSGSGWPSFYAPVGDGHVEEKKDMSHFMIRTEVLCARCNGHLGHVFPDGPKPTGMRYCINSASLKLKKDAGEGDS